MKQRLKFINQQNEARFSHETLALKMGRNQQGYPLALVGII